MTAASNYAKFKAGHLASVISLAVASLPVRRLCPLEAPSWRTGSDLHDLQGAVWSVEDFEVLDVGSSNVALEESAGTSVAQADWLPCER